MIRDVYRYSINNSVPTTEAERLVHLAMVAVESTHGESRVRLDARYLIDEAKRVIVVDATTEAGQRLNEIFVGYLRREHGEDSFSVQRLSDEPESARSAA